MMMLKDYLELPYRMEIVEDKDEGGYVASFPELPGCITCAESIEMVIKNAYDAKKVWLETAMDMKQNIPLPLASNEYSGQFKLRMPKSLHRQLAENSKKEGISMNQYCLYLLTKNDVLNSAK